jgi:hypothetical protein
MYNGIAVGWNYLPVVGGAITTVVELNDGLTVGIEEYPQYVGGTFAPTYCGYSSIPTVKPSFNSTTVVIAPPTTGR